jgi:exopolysaccharide biosynthesis polyprenyl glycosylphosphotransferase
MSTDDKTSAVSVAPAEEPHPGQGVVELEPSRPVTSSLILPSDTEVGRQVPPNPLRRDAIFRRSLVVADTLAAALALVAAGTLGGTAGLLLGCLLGPPAVVLVAKLLGLYDRDELIFHKATLDEAPSLFYLATFYGLTAWFLHDVLFAGSVGRPTIAILGSSFFALVLILRAVARGIDAHIAPPERCILAGPAGARERLARKVFQSQLGVEVVAYLPLEDERRQSDRRGRPRSDGTDRRMQNLTIHDLDRLTRELAIHRIVILPGHTNPDTLAYAIGWASKAQVKVSILPTIFEAVGSSVEFDEIEGTTLLGVRRFGLSRSSTALKRATDVVISALACILLAPVFALIAVAIRLDSQGPILFRQTRVGRGDACFEMLKFRSMVDGAEDMRAPLLAHNQSEGMFKLRQDPRVTRVGRLLRATSLDELPQLINVLRGDMSLVGPRPLILEEDGFIEGHYRGRLDLAPGMTGPWQLLGPTRVPLQEMVKMDYLYGANWSLWADIKVMLRTVTHVVARRGM